MARLLPVLCISLLVIVGACAPGPVETPATDPVPTLSPVVQPSGQETHPVPSEITSAPAVNPVELCFQKDTVVSAKEWKETEVEAKLGDFEVERVEGG